MARGLIAGGTGQKPVHLCVHDLGKHRALGDEPRLRTPHRIFRDTAQASWIFLDWPGRQRSLRGPGKTGAGARAPAPLPPDRGLLSVAEAPAASPVAEEHEEHDQVDDRGDGQADGQPLLPLAAVSGLCLSHCPPPSFVSDPFTGTTYERLRESWKLA